MSRPTVVMRFDAPPGLNHRLHILASRLQVNVRDLLLDGIYLALRFHGDGHGVPQPPLRQAPVVDDVEDVEVDEVEEETTP